MGIKNKISRVFIVFFVSSFLGFLTSVFLGRELTFDAFGKVKFFNTIVLCCTPFLLLGQDSTLVRVLSGKNIYQYNWKMFLQKFSVIIVLGCCVLVFSIVYLFNFHAAFIPLLIMIPCVAFTGLGGSILRAQEKFEMSAFLIRGQSSVLIVLLVLVSFLGQSMTFQKVFYLYAFVGVLLLSYLLIALKEVPSNGTDEISFIKMQDGFWLFLVGFSCTGMQYTNNFFIVKMLSFSSLAKYSAIITLTQGFELFTSAIWFVLMPKFAKELKRKTLVQCTIGVCVLAITITLLYVIFGKWFLDLIFSGKYNSAFFVMKYFLIIGFIKLLYVIPSSIIGGQLPKKFLKLFFIAGLACLLLNVIGVYVYIPKFGLLGAVWVVIIAWLLRLISSVFIVFRYFKEKNA